MLTVSLGVKSLAVLFWRVRAIESKSRNGIFYGHLKNDNFEISFKTNKQNPSQFQKGFQHQQ